MTTFSRAADQPARNVTRLGTPNADKLGWRLCCEIYTFRDRSFYEAIEVISGLGIRLVEPGFFLPLSKERPDLRTCEALSPPQRREMKQRMEDVGVRMVNYHAPIEGDKSAYRKIFDFAKEMTVENLVAEPPPEALETLDGLCAEYKINLAIHNHPEGSGSKYWNLDAFVKACEGRSARIGGCPDTGHWVHSGLDTLESLKKYGKRIVTVHLKDAAESGKRDSRDVPLGTGKANYKALLQQLYDWKWRGVMTVEYEHQSPQLVQEVAQCVKFVEDFAGNANKDFLANKAAVSAANEHKPIMKTRFDTNLRRAAWLSVLTVAALTSTQTMQAANYTLVPDEYGMALKSPEGRVVFTYMTRKPEKSNLAANSTCCFHPLNTPAGERLTDLAPGDHHHHRGVFLAWHTMEFHEKADFTPFGPLGPTRGFSINRGDFWGWGQFAPTQGRVITNRSITLPAASEQEAQVEIRNDWLINDKAMMEELTRAVVREQAGVYVMDLDYQLTPATELVLNQTAFGGFCVRARNDGDSYYSNPKGKILLPDPHYSVPELNWPSSEWCDYTIQLKNGKTLGVTVLDHPQNPPSTWHNPRYVWMINPCIVAQKPFPLKGGQPFHLRYRLIVHDGPMPAEVVKELNREWRKGKK